MYLEINKWVIAVKVSNFSGQNLRNHWTLDRGVLGYIGTVWPKEHSPELGPFLLGHPVCDSVNHTRFPKEDHLPDWARPDNKVTKGNRVQCPSCWILNLVLHKELSVLSPLTAELNPICHLLALLAALHILHISMIRVNPHSGSLGRHRRRCRIVPWKPYQNCHNSVWCR